MPSAGRLLLTMSLLSVPSAQPTNPKNLTGKDSSKLNGKDIIDWREWREAPGPEEALNLKPSKQRSRRGVAELVGALHCGGGCSPFALRGHGCFCGLSGAGRAVDPADRCCQLHDLCYSRAEDGLCLPLVAYIAHYDWLCFRGRPLCLDSQRSSSQSACRRELCECDRALSVCLSHAPCPAQRALCRTDTLRLFRQLFTL